MNFDDVENSLDRVIDKVTTKRNKLLKDKKFYDDRMKETHKALSIAASKKYYDIEYDLKLVDEWLNDLYNMKDKINKDIISKRWL